VPNLKTSIRLRLPMGSHWHHPLVRCWSVRGGGNTPTNSENTPDATSSVTTRRPAAPATTTKRECKSALPCRSTINGGATKSTCTASYPMERGSSSTTTRCRLTLRQDWRRSRDCSQRGNLFQRTGSRDSYSQFSPKEARGSYPRS
jgi:hypothetical protein